MTPESTIVLDRIVKRIPSGILFDQFSLAIPAGRITTLIGPNGTGKTTLLGICAGLTPVDGGIISRTVPLSDASFVFQHYRDSLFPWLTAKENLLLPLALRGMTRAAGVHRISETAEWIGIQFDLDRYPYELSGGQQQLLAFFRAIVTTPRLLFVDEPFSSLDEEKNTRISGVITTYVREHGATALCVTHDLAHARSFSDGIIELAGRPVAAHIMSRP